MPDLVPSTSGDAQVQAVPLPRNKDAFGPGGLVLARRSSHELLPGDFDPESAPDVVEVLGAAELPVGRTAQTVTVALAWAPGAGPPPTPGLELRYASGRTQGVPIGASLPSVDAPRTSWQAPAWVVGHDADGHPYGFAWLVAETIDATDPVLRVRVTTPKGGRPLWVAAVTTSTERPRVPVVRPGGVVPGPAWRNQAVSPSRLPGAAVNDVPAGGQGFVVVRDGHLALERGGRFRAWGINLVGPGALPANEDAPLVAQALANAGFNLVRLHHVDGPTAPSLVGRGGPRTADGLLDAAGVERLDRFVAELSAAGIYTWLEAQSRRVFSRDELPGTEGALVGHKLAPLFWEPWTQAHDAWLRAMFMRKNPVTGLAWSEDPSVAVLELTNENSLLAAWDGALLGDLPRAQRQALDDRWNAWLRVRYSSDRELLSAWGDASVDLGESVEVGSVRREPERLDEAHRWSSARAVDLATFYDEVERGTFARWASLLKEELHAKTLLVGTTVFGKPWADRVQRAFDLIDTHLELDILSERRSVRDISVVEDPRDVGLGQKLLRAQRGKPFVVGELAEPHPSMHAVEAPLFWSALARVQDWDGVVWFAYSHEAFTPEPGQIDGGFDLRADPAQWLQMPLASQLFRSSTLEPADGTYVQWWSDAALLDRLDAAQEPTPAGAFDVPFLLSHKMRSAYGDDAWAVGRAADRDPSDVGWWPDPGLFYVRDRGLEAVVGHLGRQGEPHEGGAGRVGLDQLEVVSQAYGAVWLASLEPARSLAEAKRCLLVAVGRSQNDGARLGRGGDVVLAWGEGPVHFLGLEGEAIVHSPKAPRVTRLDAVGRAAGAVTPRRVGPGRWAIPLDQGPWFEVAR